MRLKLAAAVAAFAMLAACGDATLVTYTKPGQDNPSHGGQGYALKITSVQPLALQSGDSGSITVLLTKQSQPVNNETVTFTVDKSAAGSTLSADSVTTSADGTASVDVTAGDPASFDVVVQTQYTNPLRAHVDVTARPIPPASLTATVAYPDQATQPADHVDIVVYDGSVTCGVTSDATLPTGLQAPQTLTDLSGSTTFTGLTPGIYATVVARGYDTNGIDVADGCTNQVPLVSGQTATVQIDMVKRDVQIAGIYDYQASFDMGSAIPGAVGTVINTIGQMFNDPSDPGLYLVTLIENQIGVDPASVPGFIQSAAISGLNDLYTTYVPATFRKWATWISQAANVVTKPDVEGTLTITNLNGSYSAKEVWQTAIFTFQGNCDPVANPGCEKRIVPLAGTEVGELTDTYPVTRQDPSLRIPSEQRQIPYAALFHLFIMKVVYPEVVPGATNTGDILTASIDCNRVASYVDGADGTQGDGFKIGSTQIFSDAQIASACTTVLNTFGSMVDSQLAQLAASAPSTVTLTGAAEIQDANKDLVCEALANGQWQGTISVSGANQPVNGTWSATRQ